MKIKQEHLLLLGVGVVLLYVFRDPIWQIIGKTLNPVSTADMEAIAAQDEADALAGMR